MQSDSTDCEAESRSPAATGDPWSRLGELEAEVAELRCLLEESRDREIRLRVALEARRIGVIRGSDPENELEIFRLTEMLEQRSSELRVIHRSKGWRLIQALRGLAGRRW